VPRHLDSAALLVATRAGRGTIVIGEGETPEDDEYFFKRWLVGWRRRYRSSPRMAGRRSRAQSRIFEHRCPTETYSALAAQQGALPPRTEFSVQSSTPSKITCLRQPGGTPLCARLLATMRQPIGQPRRTLARALRSRISDACRWQHTMPSFKTRIHEGAGHRASMPIMCARFATLDRNSRLGA
jgi:hypothetical protein